MKLSIAARFFDKVLCQDVFAPTTEFYGQLDLYDDSKRDGATVVRRVLAVAPGTIIPARRVLTIQGEQWIVGAHQADSFLGALIRDKHVLQRANGLASIQSVAQVLSTGGVSSYAGKLWVKDLKEVEMSSLLAGFFNLYLPSYETVSVGNVISVAGRLHMVRNYFLSAAGFLVAESSELPVAAVIAGSYVGTTYTPATDVRGEGAPVAANVLKIRYQDDYGYATEAETKFVEGDAKAYVRKAVVATAKQGDRVVLSGASWQVVSVTDEGDCHGLHIRVAGT